MNYTVEEPEEPLGDEGFGVVLKAYSLGEEGSNRKILRGILARICTRDHIQQLDISIKFHAVRGILLDPCTKRSNSVLHFKHDGGLRDGRLSHIRVLSHIQMSGNADLNTNGETNYTLKTAVITGPNEKEEDATEENGRKIVLGERSPSDVHLTTDPEKAKNDPNTYFMAEGSTLKLICDPTSSTDYSASVVFYDYDITDGYIYKSADQNGQKYSISEQENTHTAWYAYTHIDKLFCQQLCRTH